MPRGRKPNSAKGKPYNRSEYFKEYYEKNRKTIADRRKERYDNDPEYRNKTIEAAVSYRERKEAEIDKLISMGVLAKPQRVKKEKGLFVEINGENVEAFGFAAFASSIDRNRVTISQWIKRGIIPETPFKTSSGKRLYTSCMIGVVLDAIDKFKIVKKGNGVFEKIVHGWINCGIEENVIVEEKEE